MKKLLRDLSNVFRTGAARPQGPAPLAGGSKAAGKPDDKTSGKPADEAAGKPAGKRKAPLPAWNQVIARDPDRWTRAVKAAETGPRVLMATLVGGHPQLTVLESALNMGLTLRGAQVDTLVCDGALPACLRAKIAAMTPEMLTHYQLGAVFCTGCMAKSRAVFEPTGLAIIRLGELLTDGDKERARTLSATVPVIDIDDFTLDGLPVGEHAKAGALRFYGIGDIDREPSGEGVLRRYFEACLLTAFAMQRLFARTRYDVVVTNHGIYAPHGIINAAARAQDIRTVAWNLAYRKQCAIFSHNNTYHHTLMNEPTEVWETMAWSPQHEAEIMAYLESRQLGGRDWIWFNRDADNDMERFARETGLDWSRPVIGMLTNVVWDAQLHYPANAFSGMLDWVIQTVAYFARRPDVQLLIRVHPGELAPPGGSTVSRQPVAEEIRAAFPDRPANVFIIGPESTISTYAAMERCDSAIIYGTKTGVELTSRGIPVVVAGEAWIRNKGLTLDAKDPESYFRILDTLPLGTRMPADQVEKARKYAYHFFFRRMVPLPFLTPQPEAWPPFEVSVKALDDLEPGLHPGLDVLCDGIMTGAPFVYPAEHLGLHDKKDS